MNQTIGEIGEFGLIDLITQGLDQAGQVLVGVGDDCAVLKLSGDLAASTDTIVESVHFRTAWSSAHDVGRKVVAACVADAEAAGAVPIGVLISFAAPPETPLAWATAFAEGVREECARAGAQLVGGDTTAASQIVVTATVLADLSGRAAVTRSGATPGEVVAFRGRLGWAAAGLAVLRRGFGSPAALVDAHRVPEPPYGQGRLAALAGAGAMIDVSDGLLADLGHIAKASTVQIELDSASLVVAEPQQRVAAWLGVDPLVFVLTGGDDHALAATFPAEAVPTGWTVIGRVVSGDPQVLVDGEPWAGPQVGWEHFSR